MATSRPHADSWSLSDCLSSNSSSWYSGLEVPGSDRMGRNIKFLLFSRLARTSEFRTVLEAYWLVRAPVPISGSWGSHGGLGGRSEIATLNRPFCGVGALPLALWTAPHDNRTRSSEPCSSVSLNYQKTTVKPRLSLLFSLNSLLSLSLSS